MRTAPGCAAALATLLLLAAAAPAQALSISAPGSTNLGSVAAGQTLSAKLGPVTVTSDVALLTGWSATVTLSGQLTVDQSGQTATFPASRVKYWSGLATGSSGIGVCTPGQATSLGAVTLSSPRTAYSCGQILALASSLTWNPTLVITTQSGDYAGAYSGTITHSVS